MIRLEQGALQVARELMNRKDYAIAYWLLPEPAAREVLSQQIANLAKQFSAPAFDPHLTVFVASEKTSCPSQVLGQLGAIDIQLTIQSIQFSEQFTRTLFIQFELSDELQHLGDVIWRVCGAPTRHLVDPHLSLLYAKLPKRTKRTLTKKIRLPFGKIDFLSICAVRCAHPTTTAAEVRHWKSLAP